MPNNRELTPALLASAKAVGVMLGVSEATIRKLDLEGALPRSVEFGGKRRWRSKEIKRWIGQGCPDRRTWEESPSSTCVPQLKNADQD